MSSKIISVADAPDGCGASANAGSGNAMMPHAVKQFSLDATREEHIEQSLLAKEHFVHYMNVADFLSKSSMVPRAMQAKPADILIAMEMGLQLGIPMMQAIQDIAVINGKPCMYGDGLLAVVQGHKDYERIDERVETDNAGNLVAICSIKRKNHEEHTVSFSSDDAKKAGLWGKPGPWASYPKRMLQMRARGFCIRDTFSDALRGIKAVEEVGDYSGTEVKEKRKTADILKDLLSKNKKDKEPNKTIVLSSTEQHEAIINLVNVKDFSPVRFAKALKHYGVNELYEMDCTQANDFISILQKEPDNAEENA